MADLTFTWDRRGTAPITGGQLEKAIVNTAMKAGRDGIRTIKSSSSAAIRFRKKIRVRRVNDSLPLSFPRTRELEGLVWTMRASGEAIPLAYYPHRQGRRGVLVAVNAGPRKLIKSAFVARMKSGHVGVFVRAPTGAFGPMTRKASKSTDVFRAGRLPIEELFSTRVSDVFKDNGMVPAVMERGQAAFTRTFDRVLSHEVSKLAKQG
jgi:hypothetical protein